MQALGLRSTLLPEGVRGLASSVLRALELVLLGLDGLWTVHRKLWSVVKTMCNLADHWAVEWPARCAYWKQTESFFERLSYPVHTLYVDGCAAGLPVAKRWSRWRVMVTDARVASGLNLFRCDKSHSHSLRFVLRDTQHYPETLCRKVLEGLE